MKFENPTFKKPSDQPTNDLDRRKFLESAVSAGAAVAAGTFLMPDRPVAPAEGKPVTRLEFVDEGEKGPQEFATGELAGRKVADLFAFYFGVPEGTTLPEKLTIDFREVLETLWQKKIDFVKEREPEWLDNTRMAKRVFSERFALRTREMGAEALTLSDMAKMTDQSISDVNEHLDWKAMNEAGEAFAGLLDADVKLVKKLANQITGEMLLAFSITELMPSVECSDMNVAVYRFLLENAGSEFLQGIPAIHDAYLSVGLFQFTSYAVYDTGSEQHGASIINRFLPKDRRIPGSVVRLDSLESQLKAAHLFAIENLARLVMGMRKDGKRGAERLETLHDHAGGLDVGLLQYIASAHHNPNQARQAFREWIDHDFKGSHADLAVPVIGQYIRKSHGNYHALRAALG
jgi:hypothetical protein